MRFRKKKIIVLAGFMFPLILFCTSPAHNGVEDVEEFFWNAEFAQVVRVFGNKPFSALSVKEKLLYVECLAKTGKGILALEKMKNINRSLIPAADFYAISGLVKLSMGIFDEAERNLDKALDVDSHCSKAILGKVLLLLYNQNYSEAEKWFEVYSDHNSKKGFSQYIYLLGTEVYGASRNAKRMVEFYSKQSKRARKKSNINYKNIKANIRLYKKMAGKTQFEVELKNGRASVPFSYGPANSRHFVFLLKIKNKEYRVILDTGNATGWTIHNRMLLEKLKTQKGGRTVAIIGTEAEGLDGYHIRTKTIRLDGFKIHNLKGLFIPKPHPDFFDANLNPIFIRNMVVTIDCIKKQLVFRKKEVFEKDISAVEAQNVIKLPWYGYERAFLPVMVDKNKKGLGMIETGAEDISVKLDFARRLGYRLESRIKYLSNGKVYRFFETAVKVFLGKFLLERPKAEVWSFDRFYNRISGLSADVVLGPLVFAERYSISFDPFGKEIVIVSGYSDSRYE